MNLILYAYILCILIIFTPITSFLPLPIPILIPFLLLTCMCVCVCARACDETSLYEYRLWVICMGTNGNTTKTYIAPYPAKVWTVGSSIKCPVNYLAPFLTHKLLSVALLLTQQRLFLLPVLPTISYLNFETVFLCCPF